MAGTAGGNHCGQENPAQVRVGDGQLAVLPKCVFGDTFRFIFARGSSKKMHIATPTMIAGSANRIVVMRQPQS